MNQFIFYDSNLTSTARRLRRRATPAEKIVWSELLRNRKLAGYKFTRQKPIHYYILDFYCAELMLGIEIDGGIHAQLIERDAERTGEIESFGIKIIRYKNEDILNNLAVVKANLLRQVKIRKQELAKK